MRTAAHSSHRAWLDPAAHTPDAALCHDLRQPVAAILLLASHAAAATDGVDSGVREQLRLIQDQAAAIAEIIDAALEPVEAGSTDADGADADPDAVAEAVVALARMTSLGHVALVRGAPAARVALDPTALRRALGNVVDNAARAAGPDGSVRVSTRTVGSHVIVDVEDDGPGWGCIPAGHGIGLQYVTEVVSGCGGRVWACRTSAGRTLVRLRLPIAFQG